VAVLRNPRNAGVPTLLAWAVDLADEWRGALGVMGEDTIYLADALRWYPTRR
jgi:hypothetical protein